MQKNALSHSQKSPFYCKTLRDWSGRTSPPSRQGGALPSWGGTPNRSMPPPPPPQSADLRGTPAYKTAAGLLPRPSSVRPEFNSSLSFVQIQPKPFNLSLSGKRAVNVTRREKKVEIGKLVIDGCKARTCCTDAVPEVELAAAKRELEVNGCKARTWPTNPPISAMRAPSIGGLWCNLREKTPKWSHHKKHLIPV